MKTFIATYKVIWFGRMETLSIDGDDNDDDCVRYHSKNNWRVIFLRFEAWPVTLETIIGSISCLNLFLVIVVV